MGAQTKLKRSKCNHDDAEEHFDGRLRNIGSLFLVYSGATLTKSCTQCEYEEKIYVAGGVVFVRHDNA
jgi:hypothetical protein